MQPENRVHNRAKRQETNNYYNRIEHVRFSSYTNASFEIKELCNIVVISECD